MLMKIVSITSKSTQENTTYCKHIMLDRLIEKLELSGHTIKEITEHVALDQDTIKVISKPDDPKRRAIYNQFKYRNHYKDKLTNSDE